MSHISEEHFIIENKAFDIEDSLNTKKSLRIEAAHAGVVNGNFIFYTPKALQDGVNSLNKFYKPLQKKHYSKTIGYIYESSYQDNNVKSAYLDKINSTTDIKELVQTVKAYIKSPDYLKNKKGFGALIAKAKLYDQTKIDNLKDKDKGTVSVAGDSLNAYCSICSNLVVKCKHSLGKRYDGEVCIAIAHDLDLDHISFETIPANWETNTLIIEDSQLLGKVEIITEGQPMKLTITELKEKLGSIENVLQELGLSDLLQKYLEDVSKALKSDFVFPVEQLIPTNSKLTVYVAKTLIDSLEESEEKEIISKSVFSLFSEMFGDQTEEDIVKELLSTTSITESDLTTTTEEVIKDVTLEATPEVPVEQAQSLTITDADQLVLAIADRLNLAIDNRFNEVISQLSELFTKESAVKANKLLEDKVDAFKEDLKAAKVFEGQLSDELKNSLINQILLLKNIDKESEYFSKLKTRTVQELKLTLEDHFELFKTKSELPVVAPVEEKPLENSLTITDSNTQTIAQVDSTTAASEMSEETPLEITDTDKLISGITATLPTDKKLNKQEYTKLYKSVAMEHGSNVAKVLLSTLKSQSRII